MGEVAAVTADTVMYILPEKQRHFDLFHSHKEPWKDLEQQVE